MVTFGRLLKYLKPVDTVKRDEKSKRRMRTVRRSRSC